MIPNFLSEARNILKYILDDGTVRKRRRLISFATIWRKEELKLQLKILGTVLENLFNVFYQMSDTLYLFRRQNS